MKMSKHFIVIIVIVAGLVLLSAAAGYYYYFSIKAKQANELAKTGQSLVAEAKYTEAIPICEEAIKGDEKNIIAGNFVFINFNSCFSNSSNCKLQWARLHID